MFGRAWAKTIQNIHGYQNHQRTTRQVYRRKRKPGEQKLVETWLDENEFPDNEWSGMSEESRLVWMNDLHEELNKTIQNSDPSPSDDKTFVSLPWYRKMYFHLAAAVIIIIAAGSWYFYSMKKLQQSRLLHQYHKRMMMYCQAPIKLYSHWMAVRP